MGKKKTTQTATNTYTQITPQNTADTQAYRDQIGKSYDTPDPSIPFAFGNARNNIKDRFDNPFGADYSPEVSDAAKYSGMNSLDQAQGQAMREDSFNRGQAKTAALGGLASLTAPQILHSGGTQVTTQPSNLLGSIIGAGAGIGQMALL